MSDIETPETKEAIKLVDEEKRTIQELREGFSQLISRRGEIHFELKMLHTEADLIDVRFDELKEAETALMTGLQEKYGQGYIDLDSGEFQPQS